MSNGKTTLVLLLAGVSIACPGSAPSPASPGPVVDTVAEVPGAVRGDGSGGTTVWLVAADPLPGVTLTGCGDGASGCGGRMRLRFRLLAAQGGAVLGLVAFLHSDRKVACLAGRSGPFSLAPGVVADVEVVFGPVETDALCPTPLALTHLAAVVEGVSAVSARQEWALRYRLER